jgi:hypothetical protein
MALRQLWVRYHNILIIGLLIGGVCGLTLTPAMYVLFHALRWTHALQVLERVFWPLLLLSATACLLVYKRTKAHAMLQEETTSLPEE